MTPRPAERHPSSAHSRASAGRAAASSRRHATWSVGEPIERKARLYMSHKLSVFFEKTHGVASTKNNHPGRGSNFVRQQISANTTSRELNPHHSKALYKAATLFAAFPAFFSSKVGGKSGREKNRQPHNRQSVWCSSTTVMRHRRTNRSLVLTETPTVSSPSHLAAQANQLHKIQPSSSVGRLAPFSPPPKLHILRSFHHNNHHSTSCAMRRRSSKGTVLQKAEVGRKESQKS